MEVALRAKETGGEFALFLGIGEPLLEWWDDLPEPAPIGMDAFQLLETRSTNLLKWVGDSIFFPASRADPAVPTGDSIGLSPLFRLLRRLDPWLVSGIRLDVVKTFEVLDEFLFCKKDI